MSQHALQGGAQGLSPSSSSSWQAEHQQPQPQQQQQQQHPPRDSSRSVTSSPVMDDSPTTGRVVNLSTSASANLAGPSLSSPATSRSFRRPIPSPLSLAAAVSSTGISPSRSDFSPPNSAPLRRQTVPYSPVSASTTDGQRSPRDKLDDLLASEKTYYQSDSSGRSTPDVAAPGSPISPRVTSNDTRSVSDSVVPSKPRVDLPKSPLPPPVMAGSKAASRVEASNGPPRNSSMDSAISAATKASSPKSSQSDQMNTTDIATLVKTAGSPEAVIQYLLKEKQSQSQQNSQLWRLVDKQRAMILGLNKDLERALKDKEKYRKKLKEVMSLPEMAKATGTRRPDVVSSQVIPKVDISAPTNQTIPAPDSPSLDSDSQKHSPVDMTMAPYPITPPADHPSLGPPSAVGEMLDPSHMMPRAYEHALDKFDHEAEEKAAFMAKKQEAERTERQLKELPVNLSLPPSRSLPGEPPKMPAPKPPVSPPIFQTSADGTPNPDEGLAKFPSPPPGRKAPPAPLQLGKGKGTPTEDDETDSDFDDILQVEKVSDDRRGRRKTREEDEQIREILARKEAEARSLSKKSKSSSQKGTPVEVEHPAAALPPSPRQIPPQHMYSNMDSTGAASLAGVLKGDAPSDSTMAPPPALASPGLPSSPRPFGAGNSTPAISPPTSLGSRGLGPPSAHSGQSAPLSPRPPRQPIPMPPGTSMASPPIQPPSEAMSLTSPKSGGGSRQLGEGGHVYNGFITEEYPDLLLPPNALPAISVKVASSRMKPSRASLMSLTQLDEDPVFTLAIFSRADASELWRVEKDTMSFAKLDQKLKHCQSFTAKVPDRSLFSGHAPAKLDARRQALDGYFEELMDTPLDNTAGLELCKYLSTNALPASAAGGAESPDSAAESTETRTGPGGRPFRNGYLTKRGKNFGGWKARFFVLDGPHLKYYEAPGGAHLGTIKLPHAQIGKQSQNNESQASATGADGQELDNQYRHAFLILEPKKKDSNSHVKHVLCAESDSERDQWVDALLRWIDYRDPEEEESAAQHTSDRHQGHSNTTDKKKKKRQTNTQHEQSGADPLIGVSYDSTSQGDLPHQGGAARPKTSSSAVEAQYENASKLISGPKDMQPIADAAAWGNKSGLSVPAPTYEEKKQRKRSFFGFGPKTRSSGEGSDSLFDGGSGTSSTPPQGGGYQGPVRQVFGAPLSEAVRYNAPVDVQVPLPAVVYRCIQYLDSKNAINEEGIFRLSGSNVVIKQLRERFNTEGDINLITDEVFYDMHAVASLLKLYLRELPTTILTRDLHNEFLSVTEMTNPQEKTMALAELVNRLPLANATLLKYLIAFLMKIINNSAVNKMTVRNVGIVFSPTLNIPAPVFAMFLQKYEPIFGIDPEEYELPSPGTENDDYHGPPPAGPPPTGGLPPRPHEMQRPGTSGHSQSPHRQRLLDAVQGGNQPRGGGSTPPPLLQDLNAARASPTQNYRSTAYESHYQHQQAGYDRPIYGDDRSGGGNAPAPEQGYRSKRRESAMYGAGMMGINSQGSRSRLRDETRF